MRNLTLALALATTALVATPALARDHEWYVGVEGGALFPQHLVTTFLAI